MKAEETLRFLPLSDGKEPLFMWTIIPFFKIVHDPLFAGRILSVFCGFGTLLGISYLSWLLFKSKMVSVVSALLYSIMPFTFFFDRMALVDSMLSMFGIWTFIFSFLAIKKSRLDFAMLAGFTLGGAWLTKSPALFFALMLPTILVFAESKKSFLRGIPLTLITIIIGYAFYNILRLGPNYSLIASRNLDYVYPLGHLLVSPLDPLRPFLRQSLEWLLAMGGIGTVSLFLFSYIVNLKRYWKEILVLTVWFLIPIFVESEFAKVFTARYVLFAIPYFIIVATASFLEKHKVLKEILVVASILIISQSFIFDFYLLTNPARANLPRSERSGYLEEWTAGHGIKETADYLVNYKLLHPSEKIVIGTEGYFGTLPDGLQMYLNKYPEIFVIGVGLNFSELPKSLVDSRHFGDTTFLLINNERFAGNPEKLGLRLVAEYPKVQRPNGTRQSLLLFKLN